MSKALPLDTGAALANATETERLYVTLNIQFLKALQTNKLDEAWEASQALLRAFPSHPSSLAFKQLVEERMAGVGARGGASAAIRQKRAEAGEAAAAESDEDSDEDDEDDEDNEEEEEEEEEAGGPPTAAPAAPPSSLAAAKPAPPKAVVPPAGYVSDDDDDDDPFKGKTDTEVARQLEKLGVLQRSAERDRAAARR